MAIEREELKKIAELARLELTDEEVDRLTAQLAGLIANFEELQELDLGEAPITGGVSEKGLARRSEDLGPDLLHLPLAEFAQGWEDGFFSVPRLAALDQSELEDAFEDKARIDSVERPDQAEATGEAG